LADNQHRCHRHVKTDLAPIAERREPNHEAYCGSSWVDIRFGVPTGNKVVGAAAWQKVATALRTSRAVRAGTVEAELLDFQGHGFRVSMW